jgi:uncharacterized protein YoxC
VEKLPVSKIKAIIRLYLNGLSYSEIAAKVGVSKGTVSNVVADLKAGKFPEAGDVSEQIELLHDLAIDLKKYRITAGQAVAGVNTLTRLHELGLEPTDLERVKDMSRSLPPDAALPGFIKAALAFDKTYRRTGISFEELEIKIAELEETASRLEPLAKQTKEQRHQVEELDRKKQSLTAEIGAIEKRLQSLASVVKEKEARDLALAEHVSQLEQRAHDADQRLAAARKDLQALSSIGLSIEDLTGFTYRLSGIAQRHGIKRVELRERLLSDLEQLEKGLRLESGIKKTQEKLAGIEPPRPGAIHCQPGIWCQGITDAGVAPGESANDFTVRPIVLRMVRRLQDRSGRPRLGDTGPNREIEPVKVVEHRAGRCRSLHRGDAGDNFQLNEEWWALPGETRVKLRLTRAGYDEQLPSRCRPRHNRAGGIPLFL